MLVDIIYLEIKLEDSQAHFIFNLMSKFKKTRFIFDHFVNSDPLAKIFKNDRKTFVSYYIKRCFFLIMFRIEGFKLGQ